LKLPPSAATLYAFRLCDDATYGFWRGTPSNKLGESVCSGFTAFTPFTPPPPSRLDNKYGFAFCSGLEPAAAVEVGTVEVAAAAVVAVVVAVAVAAAAAVVAGVALAVALGPEVVALAAAVGAATVLELVDVDLDFVVVAVGRVFVAEEGVNERAAGFIPL